MRLELEIKVARGQRLQHDHVDTGRVQGGLRTLVNLNEAGSMDISRFLRGIILGRLSRGLYKRYSVLYSISDSKVKYQIQ